MEKAILKTLIYADIFDYPMTIWEIHKWLIGKKSNLRQVEKALEKLYRVESIKYQGEYYYLPKRKGLVKKRLKNLTKSKAYFRWAEIAAQILIWIPWVKLVGISGGLAMENISDKGDIDLFVVTAKNRLWISRLLMWGILSLTLLRRHPKDKDQNSAGKFCLNMILEEDQLEQQKKNLYTAHEVLQMKVLREKNGIYHKYLADNEWVFKFLPNWIGGYTRGSAGSVSLPTFSVGPASSLTSFTAASRLDSSSLSPLANFLESLAKRFQLWYMKQPGGDERIEDGALYFHPKDYGIEVLSEFKLKTTP